MDWHSLLLTPGTFEAVLLLISVVAGILGAILGLGGGVVIVPALTLLFKVNIRYAVGASIVSVIATSSGAAAVYVREHMTNIRVAMFLEVATTLGALGGAIATGYLSTRFLFLLFAAIMFYSAYAMTRPRTSEGAAEPDRWAQRLKLDSSYPDALLGRDVFYHVTGVPLAFVLMLGAGAISALLGVGSGALKVPAMDRAMKLPIKVSSATSNFMIGVTAAASAGAYYMRGEILPFLAAPVALGVLIGASLGTKLMVRLPNQKIRRAFLVVILIIGVEMAMKGLGT